MSAAMDDLALRLSIEEFLYLEAELLDDHRYDEWLALLADDIHYWAPTQGNRLRRDRGREASAPGEVALFDDDKTTLCWRVRQMGLATHWAEDPPSRTRHLVSNIRIAPGAVAAEFAVRSNFLCYRNRLRDEVDLWAGERRDVLRRAEAGEQQDGGSGPGWLIARRAITLDQNVVLSKNLSVFF